MHKHPHYWDTDGNRHDVDEWSPRHEVSKAIEYIENKGGVRDPEKPFLMMIGMNPPHSPYASTDDCDLEGYERYKDKSLTELLVRDNADTTMAKAAAVRYYFANVSGIDREFGRLLAALDKAGLTENTIVVFASDHGETMTSHSTDDPKNSIWRESLNIPFLVRYPGRVPHRVDDLLLSTPDIMPTLLGLAGLGERIPASVEGRDYSAVLRQDAVQPERPRAALYMRNLDGGRDADGLVRGFFAQARGVKTATHTMELRIGRDGTLERVLMFDDAADPYQLHNLAPEEHPRCSPRCAANWLCCCATTTTCGSARASCPTWFPMIRITNNQSDMNKLFLWIAAASAFVLQSCEHRRHPRRDQEPARPGDCAGGEDRQREHLHRGLHKLMDESTIIVGIEPNAKGYEIELSDGTRLPVILGEKIEALVPVMGIDAEGYWTVSLDGGATSERLKVGGEYVSAWPVSGGDHKPGAEGVTPQLKVSADGEWLVSLDGGATYAPLLQNGQPVNALGDKVVVSYSSAFKSVTYDATTGLLAVELLDGEKLTLPVFDDFGLTVTASDNETFRLGETRAFEVVQNNVAEAVIDAPAGWTAVLGETTLTVKAPATFDAASQQAAVSVTVYSDRKYRKLVMLNVTLLDEQVDANAALAWRNFKAGTADNVLLDYSYAGYKHGEEAPADVWGLGYKVYNVVDYGADPTGVRSSRGALAALLKELKLSGRSDAGANLANANARAVIYFPEGRFVLHNDDDNVVDPTSANQKYTDSKGNNRSEEIFIRGGYFVLKGAGRGKTTLVMDTPNLPNNSEQMWSSPMMINIKHNSGLSDLTTVTGDAARGTFSVEVASAAGIGKGDWVCLSLSNNDPTLVAQELAPHRVEGNMTDIQTITVEDYHQVASVSGNRVTFAEPIMYAVEAKWGWKIRKYPHYEHVGVEDLTFEGRSKENFGHHASWEDDGAYKPLNMMRLTDSWIRRVDFRGVSEALSIVSSANCSAYDIEISGNRGHSGVRSQSSSRIFIGKVCDRSRGQAVSPPYTSTGYFENAGQYHASGVSNTSLGAVLWNNTWGDDAFFESHSRQPRATLVDRCTGGFVQWRFGGDETNVPNHLGDLTIWNLNATRAAHDFGAEPFKWWLSSDKWWKTMPPIIVGFHGAAVTFDESAEQVKYLESNGAAVEPLSLYEAQLRQRLGYVPAWLNSLK